LACSESPSPKKKLAANLLMPLAPVARAFRKVTSLPLVADELVLAKWTTCAYITALAVLVVSTVYLHREGTPILKIYGEKQVGQVCMGLGTYNGKVGVPDRCTLSEKIEGRVGVSGLAGNMVNCDGSTLMPSLLYSSAPSTSAIAPTPSPAQPTITLSVSLLFLEMRFTDAFFPSAGACVDWIADVAEQVVKDAVTPELVKPSISPMFGESLTWQNYCVSCQTDGPSYMYLNGFTQTTQQILGGINNNYNPCCAPNAPGTSSLPSFVTESGRQQPLDGIFDNPYCINNNLTICGAPNSGFPYSFHHAANSTQKAFPYSFNSSMMASHGGRGTATLNLVSADLQGTSCATTQGGTFCPPSLQLPSFKQKPTVRVFEDVTGVPFWFLTDHDSPGFANATNDPGTMVNHGSCGTFWGGNSIIQGPPPYPQCPAFDWSSTNGKALLANGTKQLKAAAPTFCAPFESDLPPYSCQTTTPTTYSKSFALALSYTSTFYSLFTLIGPILAGMLVAKSSPRNGVDGGHQRTLGRTHEPSRPDRESYLELSDSVKSKEDSLLNKQAGGL
jgi:hypothetical protein